MLIKYLGPKPQKRIEWGEKVYIFNPTCVITNKELLLFLLHPDKSGLFEGDVSKPLHEGMIPDKLEVSQKSKPKRRGRKKKE